MKLWSYPSLLSLAVAGMILATAPWALADQQIPRRIEELIIPDQRGEFIAPKVILEPGSPMESDTIFINVNGMRFRIPGESTMTPDELSHYEPMSDVDKARFHTNRMLFLTRAAQLLSSSMIGNMFGTGAIVKDRIRWTWDAVKSAYNTPIPGGGVASIHSHVQAPGPPSMYSDYVHQSPDPELDSEKLPKLDPAVMKAFSVRRLEVIEKTLFNMDRSFWSRPYLVADSNEIGVYASLGLTAFGGFDLKGLQRKGGLGGSLDFGIFIGWNKTDSSAVLQFFRMTEKFRGTMTAATGNAAVVPKWGVMFANVEPGKETAYEKGTVHYPPTPPGLSAYYLSSEHRFAAGTNPPIGLVPWPFDAILVYSMDYVMKPILRMNFRFEVLKQFIKVDTGGRGEFRSLIKSSVKRSVNWVQATFTGRSMCISVHGRFRQ